MPPMKILKYSVAILLAISGFSAYALNFYPQKYIQNPTAAEKKVKWSNMEWGNSHDFDTNMPKGFKPGPFDEVHLRHYGQTVTVDEDVSIGVLGLGLGCLFESTKHTIKVRYNALLPITNNSRMRLDSCTLEVGRMWEFWLPPDATSAGTGTVDLIDTTATVKGDFFSVFHNVFDNFKQNSPGGARINLTGKTTLSIAGVILDDFYKTRPNLTFKFTFTEKDGNVPNLKISKRSDITECVFDLVLTSNVKTGRYPIITHENRLSPSTYRNFMVNGSKHTIGEQISVGGKTAVLEFEGKDRNSQDKNCLVLVVK